ncbi:uricase [Paenibacillus albidus]|uniref:2-oxo-4-hydroxy-4-carboxy-5-ureidoimidazoline decarboxylase n=1 Tax=Paenibacillus albidus TaxID=2041023 RepID=A0A917CBG4_9BACL|nr:2-oxo-4-hydroxy-4-carboxy-5-ureidoimidazoline decarboxylase [Paenibacillus albidus]GGF81449.1 uricase [Paenibacillus albidus]
MTPSFTVTLDEINAMDKAAFIAALGGIFEHSPWVAEGAYRHIPFRSVEELHKTMLDTACQAERGQVAALLSAHPDLATRLQVTPLSAAEQRGAGLDRLTPEEFTLLNELKRKYTDKFKFPFILAVRGKTKDEIIEAIGKRVHRSRDEEWAQAQAEIGHITGFRLRDLVREG